MYTYTKEEVKTFLESKSNDNSALIRSLDRKGFEVKTNGRRGANLRFELNKELKVEGIEAILGFKPVRPRYTILLLKILIEGEFVGTYEELASEVKHLFDETVDGNNIGKTYRELVEHGFAISSTEAKEQGMRELRKDGFKLTEEDKVEFFARLEEVKEILMSMGIDADTASQTAFKKATEEFGRIYSVPFKLLNFPVEHIEWIKKQ